MKFKMIVALLAVSGMAQAGSPVRATLSAGWVADDNVTRGSRGRDIEDDSYLGLEAASRYQLPLGSDSFVAFEGALQLNRYQTFDKLSNNRLRIGASYHIRPSSGFTAAGYFASLTYEKRMVDSDQRDGAATRLGLGMHKRFTDALAMSAGIIVETVDANSVVFETDNNRLYVDFEWLANASNAVYLTLSRYDGDIVATTRPASGIIAASDAIVRDDAYLSLTPDRFAYRLNATTAAIKIGDAFAIDSRQGLDVSIYVYNASAYRDYSGSIFSLFYSWSF